MEWDGMGWVALNRRERLRKFAFLQCDSECTRKRTARTLVRGWYYCNTLHYSTRDTCTELDLFILMHHSRSFDDGCWKLGAGCFPPSVSDVKYQCYSYSSYSIFSFRELAPAGRDPTRARLFGL